MHLSPKGRLVIAALVELALREESRPVSLSAICKRLHVSQSYLEQLFGKLRRQRIVKSRRGAHGGYSLARDAQRITLAEILQAVDDPAAVVETDRQGASPGRVVADELWARIDAKVIEHLQAISLRDLASRHPATCTLIASPAAAANGVPIQVLGPGTGRKTLFLVNRRDGPADPASRA